MESNSLSLKTNMAKKKAKPVFRGIYVEVRGPVLSSLRRATREELKDAKGRFAELHRLREQLAFTQGLIKILEDNCQHLIVYDVEGHPYDHRYCSACDHPLGTV